MRTTVAYRSTQCQTILKRIFCAVASFLILLSFALGQANSNGRFIYRGNQRIDARTNVVRAWYNVHSCIYQGTAEQVARQFMDENKDNLGIQESNDLKIVRSRQNESDRSVDFHQEYKGIPVFDSYAVVSLSPDNRVIFLVNGFKQNVQISSTTPAISSARSIELAKEHLKTEESSILTAPSTQLYLYQDSTNTNHLVWLINFISAIPSGDWQVLVDAMTGSVLSVQDISLQYQDGRGWVFRPDPITKLRDASLRDQNDAADAVPNSAYDMNAVLRDLNEADGNGRHYLSGKYARSEDREPDQPPSGWTKGLQYMISPVVYEWSRNHPGFEEVNAYYHIDNIRRYLESVREILRNLNHGIDAIPEIQWKDQNGSWKDAIGFDAHGTGEGGYSAYKPLENGSYIAFTDVGVDDAEDMGIIVHEYWHAVHDALQEGLGIPSTGDERAISEGTGDYLAVSYRRTYSDFQPDKITPWDGNDEEVNAIPRRNPGRTLRADYNFKNAWVMGDKYACGTVWASTMMDIEQAIGRDATTGLILLSTRLTSSTSTVVDHVNAILTSDLVYYNGAHLYTLGKVFYDRKFFQDNSAHSNSYLIHGDITPEYWDVDWSGSRWVDGPTTIKSGVTVTVPWGAFLFVGEGQSITVESGANLNLYSPDLVVCYGSTPCLTYQDGSYISTRVNRRWNTVSIPNIVSACTPDLLASCVYPYASSIPSYYDPITEKYYHSTNLAMGTGYWLKFPYDQTVTYDGTPVNSKTIDVISGWNLIGSISKPVPTGSIVLTPSGNSIGSPYYDYSPTGWLEHTTIDPGRGYWVKVNMTGTLTLSPGQSPPPNPPEPPPPPSASDLISPINSATTVAQSPLLRWDTASSASSYQLQVSTSQSFQAPLVVDDSTITTLSYQVYSLSFYTTYYWRVRGKNTSGIGPWSDIWSFTTGGPPPAPTLVSPTSGTQQLMVKPTVGTYGQPVNPTLSWNAVSSASNYHVQVSTSSSFNSIYYETWISGGTSVETRTLEGTTTYYWHVNAQNSFGASAWSETRNFTTQSVPAPSAVTLQLPTNGAVNEDVQPIIDWTASQYATSYRLQIATSSSFSPTNTIVVDDSTIISPGYDLANPLDYSTLYYWRVRAKNNSGTSWSTSWNFTTMDPLPPHDPNPCDPTSITLMQMDHVTITDANGYSQTLYVHNGSRRLDEKFKKHYSDFELPPEPPSGIFSARYKSGKFVETIPARRGSKRLPITLRDAVYPVVISWSIDGPNNRMNYTLLLRGEGGTQIPLSGSAGSIVIEEPISVNGSSSNSGKRGGKGGENNSPLSLRVHADNICYPAPKAAYAEPPSDRNSCAPSKMPSEYYLAQCRPNPFNPTTIIEYSLPEDATVSLRIYNTLGQQVGVLINGELQSAGYRSVRFDASQLSSGIYFYRLQAGKFTDVKKMMLLK